MQRRKCLQRHGISCFGRPDKELLTLHDRVNDRGRNTRPLSLKSAPVMLLQHTKLGQIILDNRKGGTTLPESPQQAI